MPKLRKQRRRKVYKHSVNRKRMKKRLTSTGPVNCPEIKAAWEHNKTIAKNLQNMGLVYDPNKNLRKSNVKQDLTLKIASSIGEQKKIETETNEQIPEKKYVADLLEQEANAPRKRNFQLPKGQVEFLTYLMDKYGSNFRAMAKDKRNQYQETWKQIRSKIKIFKGIPEQYGKYLESRGLQNKETENVEQSMDTDDDD